MYARKFTENLKGNGCNKTTNMFKQLIKNFSFNDYGDRIKHVMLDVSRNTSNSKQFVLIT